MLIILFLNFLLFNLSAVKIALRGSFEFWRRSTSLQHWPCLHRNAPEPGSVDINNSRVSSVNLGHDWTPEQTVENITFLAATETAQRRRARRKELPLSVVESETAEQQQQQPQQRWLWWGSGTIKITFRISLWDINSDILCCGKKTTKTKRRNYIR